MDKNPEKIQNMFDELSSKYDFMNNLISLGLHKIVKKLALNQIQIPYNAKVLDCCTGTGDIAKFIKLKNPSAEVVGIDFSPKMLKLSQKKVKNVEFIQADCTNLPFKDETFDIVTIFFGLRNIQNYNNAILEIKRVLKKGGLFVHLDFAKGKISNTVFNFLVPIVTKIFYGNKVPYEYLIKSKDEFPQVKELIRMFTSYGFKPLKEKNYLLKIISAQILTK